MILLIKDLITYQISLISYDDICYMRILYHLEHTFIYDE